MRGGTLLAALTARTHRITPTLAARLHTDMFSNTRGLGAVPDDLCPLGARRVDLDGVPRVASAYTWGGGEPTVLALHGWGTDSTTMAAVVAEAVANGHSAVCFDAPGHGVSPGAQATLIDYATAVEGVLRHFIAVRTVVAHSLSAIAAVSAVAGCAPGRIDSLLLLAPACSLQGVLDRWSRERRLPAAVAGLVAGELHRRDGFPVAHWDITTLGLPGSVRVLIVHDPTDPSVPFGDARRIAAGLTAEVRETTPGTGHHGILGCDEMRAALTVCLGAADSPAAATRRASPCQ